MSLKDKQIRWVFVLAAVVATTLFNVYFRVDLIWSVIFTLISAGAAWKIGTWWPIHREFIWRVFVVAAIIAVNTIGSNFEVTSFVLVMDLVFAFAVAGIWLIYGSAVFLVLGAEIVVGLALKWHFSLGEVTFGIVLAWALLAIYRAASQAFLRMRQRRHRTT